MGIRRTLWACLLAVLPRTGLADDALLFWPDPAGPQPQPGFSLQLGGSFSVRDQVGGHPVGGPQTMDSQIGGGQRAAPAVPGRAAAVFAATPPPDSGPRATRGQVRVGMGWQGARASAYYGVTYLTPQFSNQPEGQLIGSFSLSLRF